MTSAEVRAEVEAEIRAERNQLLDDLRARGVQEYVTGEHGIARVVFFPPALPARPESEAPLPPAKRTLDDRLLRPLGIGEDIR